MTDLPLGWAGRVMDWLDLATRLVLVNLLFVAGTLAGLVFLGVFPAAVAATTVLAGLRAGVRGHLVRTFVGAYRSAFLHSNRVGSIFSLAGVVLLLNLATAAAPLTVVHAALLLLSGVAGAGVVLAAATAVTLCARGRDPLWTTWTAAVTLPLVSPGMSGAILLGLAALAVTFFAVPALVPLAGASVPLLVCGALVERRLDALRTRAAGAVDSGARPEVPA